MIGRDRREMSESYWCSPTYSFFTLAIFVDLIISKFSRVGCAIAIIAFLITELEMLICITGQIFAGQELLAKKVVELGCTPICYKGEGVENWIKTSLADHIVEVDDIKRLMLYYYKNWTRNHVLILREVEEWDQLACTGGAILVYIGLSLRKRLQRAAELIEAKKRSKHLIPGLSFYIPTKLYSYIEWLVESPEKLSPMLRVTVEKLVSGNLDTDVFMLVDTLYEYCRFDNSSFDERNVSDANGQIKLEGVCIRFLIKNETNVSKILRKIIKANHRQRNFCATHSDLRKYSRFSPEIHDLTDLGPIDRTLLELKIDLRLLRRTDWDEHFMELSRRVATRASCIKRRAGAVVTRNKHIVTTGYNGTASNFTNCSTGGCDRCSACAPKGTRLEECLCLHAEQNALLEIGYSTLGEGVIVYCTSFPCMGCAKILVQCGVKKVVYENPYADDAEVMDYIKECNIEVVRLQSKERGRRGQLRGEWQCEDNDIVMETGNRNLEYPLQ